MSFGWWYSLCRLLRFGVVVGVLPPILSGCTYFAKDGDSDKVTTTTICIFAMCETADRVERTGNLSGDGDITEEVREDISTEQGEEGQLAVDPTGL